MNANFALALLFVSAPAAAQDWLPPIAPQPCPVAEFVDLTRSIKQAGFTVRFDTVLDAGDHGSYDAASKTVYLLPNDVGSMYLSLVHELAHATHVGGALDLYIYDTVKGSAYPTGFFLDEVPAFMTTVALGGGFGVLIGSELLARGTNRINDLSALLTPQAQQELSRDGVAYVGNARLFLALDPKNGDTSLMVARPSQPNVGVAISGLEWDTARATERVVAALAKAKEGLLAYNQQDFALSNLGPRDWNCTGSEPWQKEWEDILSETFWAELRAAQQEELEESLNDQFWMDVFYDRRDALSEEFWRDWQAAPPTATDEPVTLTASAWESWWWPPGVDCDVSYCGPYLTWDVVFDSVVLGQPVSPNDFAWDPTIWGASYWTNATWDDAVVWQPAEVMDWFATGPGFLPDAPGVDGP